jgi:hypothetical protein
MTEEEVLWELPLNRGLAYFHAAMCQNGAECQWLGQTVSTEMQEVMDFIERKPWRR